MQTKRTTRIEIQTERVLVIEKRNSTTQSWCEGCGRQVKLVTLEMIAIVTGLSVRSVFRMLEAGEIHFLETPNGSLFICLDSLLRGDRDQESQVNIH